MVLAGVALGVLVRVLLLAFPPLFFTDVSYYNVQAVRYLLQGVDPYGAAYSVPSVLATPGASNVFAYLPGVFAFIVPGVYGTGARVGLVASDLVIAGSLLSLRRWGGVMAAIFLLFPPVVVFSTSFLNDALPAIAFMSVAVALEARGRGRGAAVFFGLAFASSQEAWFAFPVYCAYCLRGRRLALPALSAATAFLVAAPFLAWDAGAFVYDTVLFQFQRAPLPLFSSGPFGTNLNPSLQGLLLAVGASAPLVLRGAVALAVVMALAWRGSKSLEDLLAASAVGVAASLFLLSGDLFWGYLELPFVLGLLWGVLKIRSGEAADASTLKGGAAPPEIAPE